MAIGQPRRPRYFTGFGQARDLGGLLGGSPPGTACRGSGCCPSPGRTAFFHRLDQGAGYGEVLNSR